MSDNDPTQPRFNRRKVHVGLAIIVVVVVISTALAFVVPNPVLRVFFAGLVVVALLQTWRLTRVIRGEQND